MAEFSARRMEMAFSRAGVKTAAAEEYEVSSIELPEVFDGLRIVYASDIHYGTLLGEKRVADLAQRLNALKADIIILGGDYGEDAAHSFAFFEKLPPLAAKIAVCGALGMTGMWEAVFADVGVMVLAVMNAVRAMKIK